MTDEGYRLDVVAAGVDDVVTGAAGWLYDRAAAGWRVNVYVPRTAEVRGLHILGATVRQLQDAVLDAHELAVSAEVFAGHPGIREAVSRALSRPMAGVMLWGQGWPMPIAHVVRDARYRLSSAALAFKRQALIATGLAPHLAAAHESFLTDLTTYTAVGSGLVQAGR